MTHEGSSVRINCVRQQPSTDETVQQPPLQADATTNHLNVFCVPAGAGRPAGRYAPRLLCVSSVRACCWIADAGANSVSCAAFAAVAAGLHTSLCDAAATATPAADSPPSPAAASCCKSHLPTPLLPALPALQARQEHAGPAAGQERLCGAAPRRPGALPAQAGRAPGGGRLRGGWAGEGCRQLSEGLRQGCEALLSPCPASDCHTTCHYTHSHPEACNPLWSPSALIPKQELRVFLETEGSLATSLAWQQLQPTRGTLVEGIARLPRQLIGARTRGCLLCSSALTTGRSTTCSCQCAHAFGCPLPQAPNSQPTHQPPDKRRLPPLPHSRLRAQRSIHGGGAAERQEHERPAATLPGAGGAHAAGGR